jgi:phage replication-related protein YjqB (UPF0714/DUF867 family)
MKPDRYRSFEELAAREREGIDYQIRSHRRPSRIAVIAPHGGKIEEHTAEIAEAIAGEHFSFYAFEGIKRGRNHDLHITSTRFDEPECVALVEGAELVVAVHGLHDASAEYVCVGGSHAEVKQRLVHALREAEFDAREDGDPGHAGTDAGTICNRRAPGVQLEISRALRQKLQDGTSEQDEFAAAVRGALLGWDRRPA